MKNLIYISAISFLLLSLFSCYTSKTLTSQEEFTKYVKKSNDSSDFNKKVKVLLVVTKQGDSVSFTKKTPGRIFAKEVAVLTQGHLSFNEIDSIVFKKHSVSFAKSIQSIWMNGKQYEVILRDETGILYHDSVSARIPLSEIKRIKVIKFSLAGTILLPVSAILVSFTAAFFINVLTCEGCWI